MRRFVVLPFGLPLAGDAAHMDIVLAAFMARDLAARLEVHGELDVEFADPLSPDADAATYVYAPHLAGELAPMLVERLGLDGVLFGELALEGPRARLGVRLLNGDGEPVLEWETTMDPERLLSLNVTMAQMVHLAFDVVPSARETEVLDTVQTDSLEALRCVALADALDEDESDEAAEERVHLLEQAMGADPAYAEAVIRLASDHYVADRIAEAEGVLERHMHRYDSRAVRVSRARLAMVTGDVEGAVERATLLTEEDPYDAEAHRILASTLASADRWEEAAFAVQSALWSLSGDRPLTRILVRCLVALGDYTAAHRILADLREESPDDVGLLNELAYAHAAVGRIDEAEDVWGQVIAAFPGHRLARQGVARVHMAKGHPALALLALWGDADDPGRLEETDRYLLATALLLQGEDGLARVVSPESLDILDSASIPRRERRAPLLLLGELALFDGDGGALAEALESWKELGALDALEDLTRVYWEVELALLAGELALAEKRVRALDGVALAATVQRLEGACARATQGEVYESAERIATLLAILERGAPHHLVKAAALRHMNGDSEGALTWLAGLLDGSPSPEAVVLVAQILLEEGQAEHAAEIVDAVVARSTTPRYGMYEAVAAWLAAHTEDVELFALRARASLAHRPPFAVAWLLEGALERLPKAGPLMRAILEDTPEGWEASRDSEKEGRAGTPGAVPTVASLREDGEAVEEASAAADMAREAALEAHAEGDAIAVKARLWLALGEPERARQTIERALTESTAEMEYVLGLASVALGDAARAEASWRRALLRDPSHHEVLVHLGKVFMMRGEHARAVVFLERALRARPTSGVIFSMVRDAMLVTLSGAEDSD